LSLETTGTLEAYAKTTMHRHKILIRAKLGYRHYAPAAHAALAREADFLLSKHMRLKEIFGVLLAKLAQQKVEVPSYHRLADLITAGFRTYEKRLLSAVENSLRREDKTFLDGPAEASADNSA
jgi:hypothetical protein